MTSDRVQTLAVKLPGRVVDGFPVNAEDGVFLSVTELGVDQGNLVLDYRVSNRSSSHVYLVNQLFHREPEGFRVDPNQTYNSALDDSTLLLAKQVIDVPADMRVEAPEVPYVLRLEDGADFSERVIQPLPVAPRDPYRPQRRLATAHVLHRVVFSLGYVLADQSIRVADVVDLSGAPRLWIDYTSLRRRQRLRALGPFPATVDSVIEAPEPGR